MKLLLAILVTLTSCSIGAACTVEGPRTLFANASYQWQTNYSYSPEGRKFLENPRIQISDCEEAAAKRKLLMIGMGADYLGLSSDTASVAYNGKLQPDICQLEGNPFEKSFDFDLREQLYQKRTQFINSCALLVVRHAGMRNLQNVVSPQCQIEQIDGNTVHIRGGYCFFSVYPDSYFEVTTQIDSRCTERANLVEMGIDPMEVFGHVNFFIAGDASGISQDLTPLKSIALRYSIEPEDNLVPLSESYFDLMPRWPNNWVLPDLHLGHIKLKKVGSNFSLRPTLVLDNRCPKRCLAGLCSSSCDFAMPVTGNYTLWRLDGAKPEVMATWYDGGIAPPHWQGVIPGDFHNLGQQPFEVGGRYKLTFVLGDPKEDFIFFAKQAGVQRLRLSGLGLSEMKIGDSIPEIKDDWGLAEIAGYDTIASVTHANGLYILRDLDLGLGELREFHYWPPYYERICEKDSLHCLAAMGSNYLNLSLSFTISGLEGREYQFSDLIVERYSPLSKNYRKQVQKLPQISCKSL